MPISYRFAALLLPLVTFALGAPSHAAEADFLQRFCGKWSGAGLVQRDAAEDPRRVRCTMQGAPSENGVSMQGTCRAAIIASRRVGADIRYDPDFGRYTGTYVGSVIGPARLSGKREGDAVNSTITWPKPVNGDTKAAMTIQNDGGGRLRILVSDEARPGGPRETVTEISLARR